MSKDTKKKQNDQAIKIPKGAVSSSGKKAPMRIHVGYIFVGLFILIYVPSIIKWFFTEPIPTDIITEGTVEESIETTGVLMRDEVLLHSDIDGRYIYDTVESKRVAKGGTVADVVNSTGIELTDKMMRLNEQIYNETINNSKDTELYNTELNNTDREIKAEINKLIQKSFSNDFKYSDNIRRDIDGILEQRGHLLKNIVETPVIKDLKEQLKQLETQKANNTCKILAPASGVVSYVLDHYEEQLNIENAGTLSESLYNQIVSGGFSETAQSEMVTHNQSFVKIISSRYVLLGIYVDSKYTDFFNNKWKSEVPGGQNVTIKVRELGENFTCEVNSVTANESGRTLVLLKSYDLLMNTSKWRKLNIDVIMKKVDGFKVPISSLLNYKEHGDTAKLMLVKLNFTVLKDVKCLSEDGVYAIIEPIEYDYNSILSEDGTVSNEVKDDNAEYTIQLYDKFVVNPQNVKEGKIISR